MYFTCVYVCHGLDTAVPTSREPDPAPLDWPGLLVQVQVIWNEIWIPKTPWDLGWFKFLTYFFLYIFSEILTCTPEHSEPGRKIRTYLTGLILI